MTNSIDMFHGDIHNDNWGGGGTIEITDIGHGDNIALIVTTVTDPSDPFSELDIGMTRINAQALARAIDEHYAGIDAMHAAEYDLEHGQ